MSDLLSERFVLVLTGISAAGKSTVADLLARRLTKGVHVRGDAFRKMVVSGRAEMTSNPSAEAWAQYRLRNQLTASTADAYFDAGFSVVLQDVLVGPVLGEMVDRLVSRPLYVVVLTPSPDSVARREAGRAKSAYSGPGPSIAQFDHALRTETPRLGLWIDTSDQKPDETVDEIVHRAMPEALVHAGITRGVPL
jgi:chloramphenicol 3-O-phosphotransferase